MRIIEVGTGDRLIVAVEDIDMEEAPRMAAALRGEEGQRIVVVTGVEYVFVVRGEDR